MILLTNELKKRLPKQVKVESKGDSKSFADAIVYAKFFHPFSEWRWYVLSGEPSGDDFIFWGYVEGEENEFGCFSLSELKALNIMGLPMERDILFDGANKKLGEVCKL